ncbi:protein mono-ADP-ribosyltransferase PARP14-like isoform X1 [Gambusia affinis]|uniref:protein mono-ADP-ribosyltransferase PARP14-like isoform X1 n=1 Tax=Gambusia affinis TaxID=33528 RepID=UPI001CDD4DA2|nr:protein mono-ADP-ribosyltransferase PARP14-like isoform X1 [Gambusia affinis]XP_043953300.1 protein mono-ADP-ribosyltransferase PARP14-like isoform X1 [Gambusia affinis]XP_043953301.1 protein mono-ADP-ribosyltransferase PARP14-like isoform X1 [Gambusia affinis]XP_043953302.1 protein mono-ADP-ribosyltransferase PARP14-like isoform X1 [Gambusia affinis]XP_043953303.1 protein mono-ADP-ribosyltransferase PARP14-like isoform X1 [Gambusia affinis]
MNDFAKGQRLSYPKVDILRNTNIVILKGPGNIRPTNPHGQNTSDLERRINLPQDVITFIKSSNAVRKYQTLFQQRFRNPVFIEVGSDLVLFCKCPHDLDEAQAELVGDLSVEIVKLQGAATAPPDTDRIKETLMKAKTVLNRDELRVDFSFIPGQGATTVAKVRLVGYAEYVKNLRDVLQDYLLNQVFTKEVLNLQHPEMVDCFGKILELISIKQTQVTLKQSLQPKPCVTISGPRCHVQEAHKALRSGLASLTLEKLVLDGPGAVRYFQAEGKTSKELVESSCKVLIQERQVSAPRQFIFSTPSLRHTTTTSQQSSFLFVGLQRQNVDAALTKIKNLYQDHSATKTFTNQDLADLTEEDIKKLMNLVETQDLYVQENPLSQGGLTVSGLKAGVNQVNQMLQTLIPLRKELRAKEEESLYPGIAWCILGQNGNWERLPKTGNYNLEKKNITKGIVDAHGVSWSVNLLKMEARRDLTGQTAKLKRLENLPDFTFPLYWDKMSKTQDLEQVLLDPSSAEHRTVQQGFNQTAHNKTIVKIERLQNVHLRRTYEMQKKHISEKNKNEGGVVERLLYHGTSQENLNSIKTKGFNRSFSGKHATVYGQGTYFAVNAGYSVSYAHPAADGTQTMFVARVLTGLFTQGRSDMRIPPPRNSQQPHDRYDSLVDNINNPSMFVVFHDNQAYPDYLITFR